MPNNGCILIDTKAFSAVENIQGELVSDFAKIKSDYDKIINTLLQNWKGRGAEAFKDDANKVKTNIGGISDILTTMSSTLTDCKQIIETSDKTMGDYNRNPGKGQG